MGTVLEGETPSEMDDFIAQDEEEEEEDDDDDGDDVDEGEAEDSEVEDEEGGQDNPIELSDAEEDPGTTPMPPQEQEFAPEPRSESQEDEQFRAALHASVQTEIRTQRKRRQVVTDSSDEG